MKFYLKIKGLFVYSILIALISACSSTLKTQQNVTPSNQRPAQPVTANNKPHTSIPNLYILPADKFDNRVADESIPAIKQSAFSNDLEKALQSKSEKNYNISGDVYLNDAELGTTPVLDKLDGGYIDIEVKFD